MFFRWLRNRRRAKVLAAPFPEDWLAILHRNVGLYKHLSEAERTKLRDDLRIFIAETNFEGCAGLEITDEIKVTIAALASILLLGFQHDYFERVHTVLVYPAGFRSPKGWTGPDGVVRMDVGNLGEAWHHGTVILAWDSVLDGGRDSRDGRNVVLHEFAHQIDYLDGFADGVPPLRDRAQYRKWHEVMTAEYNRLVAESQHGWPMVLDSYGATNQAEFFAVATEAFFETPEAMQQRHPRLYEVLKEYYCQDPARRFTPEEEPAPGRIHWTSYKPYRGSRKWVPSASRSAKSLDWPGWVSLLGFDPSWQRLQALGYLETQLWMIFGFAMIVAFFYFFVERWNDSGTLAFIGLIGFTAIAGWFYLAIRWIDRHAGWAEQQTQNLEMEEG
jgi:MtfA peptidase